MLKTWLVAALGALLLAGPAAAQGAPDGMKVIFCGTSGPLPVKDRAKPCVAVQAAGKLYLVDVGPEATKNLMLWRTPIETARAVFLTHLHSDHIGGLGEFNLQSWVAGRPAPVALVGPTGTDKVAAGFNLAYEADHGFRKAHHEHGAFKFDLAAGLFEPRTIPTPAGDGRVVVWRDGDMTVTAIRVAHEPVTPAYGYRFDYKGRSVVISGDTAPWPPLGQASKGADVLIHEAQNADMTRRLSQVLGASGNSRMSSLMMDTLSYHTTPTEAADLARDAGVKRLVLYHLTQAGLPFFDEASFTKGMPGREALDWRLASDGMTIDLPSKREDVLFGHY